MRPYPDEQKFTITIEESLGSCTSEEGEIERTCYSNYGAIFTRLGCTLLI